MSVNVVGWLLTLAVVAIFAATILAVRYWLRKYAAAEAAVSSRV